MILALFLTPFVILAQATENAVDLKPLFRQEGFKIPGFDNVCHLLSKKCEAKSTECMIAQCSEIKGNVCWGLGKEVNSYCEEWMHDVKNNWVAVPGVCVEGVCVHVPEKVECQNGHIHAFRTFPSCGTVGFGKTFRFTSKKGSNAESFVITGVHPETFGPDLAHVKVTTSHTINDGDYGIPTISYLDKHYGDCIIGQDSENCKISAKGTYHLMGMTVKWDPDSGNADARETTLELENQVIELEPKFHCSTNACRTTIKMDGSSPTPCGDTQLTCQRPCKYRVSGFETWPELNGEYVERVSAINGFSAYSKMNEVIHVAKALKVAEWWFDDDLSDYDSREQTANVKAYLPYSASQNPFDSQGFFHAFEKPAQGEPIQRSIQIRQKCRSSPGPCGDVEALHSTHKFWSVAYGTVRFQPPHYEKAFVTENPDNPYNMALLGDPITTGSAEFSVEVTFRGQMVGIVVFGSENSYVMCRLDSTTGDSATGISIVQHPNTMVVNGKEENGQLPNRENTHTRLNITIHDNVVTCYSSGLAETSELVPRVTGEYTGPHTGRFGFVTLNAAASFRILGCPNTTPNPPTPPCIPITATTTTRSIPPILSVPIEPASASGSDSSESESYESVEFDGDDSDDDGGHTNFFNFGFGGRGGDSDDDVEAKVGDSHVEAKVGDSHVEAKVGDSHVEAKVGDSGDGVNGGDSDDGDGSTSFSGSASDSAEIPDMGPTCLPQPVVGVVVPGNGGASGSASASTDSESDDSDSFDVEAAIGVQSQSLSHAVFEDRILYLLASIGFATSQIILYRLFCTKEDYEVVAEPELEEL